LNIKYPVLLRAIFPDEICNACAGLVVPMPTLPFVVSTSSTLVDPPDSAKLNAEVVFTDGAKVVEPEEFVDAVHWFDEL
jgi:hypothetical protein